MLQFDARLKCGGDRIDSAKREGRVLFSRLALNIKTRTLSVHSRFPPLESREGTREIIDMYKGILHRATYKDDGRLLPRAQYRRAKIRPFAAYLHSDTKLLVISYRPSPALITLSDVFHERVNQIEYNQRGRKCARSFSLSFSVSFSRSSRSRGTRDTYTRSSACPRIFTSVRRKLASRIETGFLSLSVRETDEERRAAAAAAAKERGRIAATHHSAVPPASPLPRGGGGLSWPCAHLLALHFSLFGGKNPRL